MAPALRVCLLGGFQFHYHDTTITTINSIRQRDLLACLILRRRMPQSRSELAYQFWPDSSEEQARANLRNLLYLLRQAFPEITSYLISDGQLLQWRGESVRLDLSDFEDAIARAARADAANQPQQACMALEEAVGYYQGDLLPNCYDDWILPERERLSQMYMNALERLTVLWEQQRNYSKAIQYAQTLLHYDSLRESTYRILIRLYALNEDRAAVIRIYRTCAQVLRRELSVEPSTMTRQTYEDVLRTGLAFQKSVDAPRAMPRLLGRTAQWGNVLRAWQQAVSVQPGALLVVGEFGMGKTRLLQELQQWAGHQGIATAYTTCRPSEAGLDFAALTAWLRSRPLPLLDKRTLSEIARLLPQVLHQWPGTPAPVPLDGGWQRHALYEALNQALQVDLHPLILILDDIQWCDAGTLAWLQTLMYRHTSPGLLVVGALDPAELLENPPVLEFLNAMQGEDRLVSFTLPPLNHTQAAVLLHDVFRSQVSPAQAGHLFRQSEGNPLFLVELARAEDETAAARPVNGKLPSRLQMLLSARLQRLSQAARLLVGIAAMGDEPFNLETLQQACALEEAEFLDSLEETCQRRILREYRRGYFGFTSGLLRRAAFDELGAARRSVYQQRLAIVQPAGWQEAPPDQLAFDL